MGKTHFFDAAVEQARLVPLTEEDKTAVWSKIFNCQTPEDEDPERVISDDFGGDVDAYLSIMAEFYSIPVGQPGQKAVPKILTK